MNRMELATRLVKIAKELIESANKKAYRPDVEEMVEMVHDLEKVGWEPKEAKEAITRRFKLNRSEVSQLEEML